MFVIYRLDLHSHLDHHGKDSVSAVGGQMSQAKKAQTRSEHGHEVGHRRRITSSLPVYGDIPESLTKWSITSMKASYSKTFEHENAVQQAARSGEEQDTDIAVFAP